jgi:26S proteasome regulatory subunit T4
MYERTENYLKNLEAIGQLVGEVLQRITDEKIMVKAASGPRYVVGVRPKIDKNRLKPGVRVTLDMTTYTIMSILPREVDMTVHNMSAEDPGNVLYGDVGGLTS